MNFTETIYSQNKKIKTINVADFDNKKPKCSSELSEDSYIEMINMLKDEVLINTYEKRLFFKNYLYKFSDSTYRFGLCAKNIQSNHKRKICPFDYRTEYQNDKNKTKLYFIEYQSEENKHIYKCSGYCQISLFIVKNNALLKDNKVKPEYAEEFWKMIEETLKNFKRR